MNLGGRYILIDREVIKIDDILVWGKWLEDNRNEREIAKSYYRHPHHDKFIGPPTPYFMTTAWEGKEKLKIGSEEIEFPKHVQISDKGDIQVSTVFLGLDHGFGKHKEPMVFETMVFGLDEIVGTSIFGEMQARYATYDQALDGHQLAETMTEICIDKIRRGMEVQNGTL